MASEHTKVPSFIPVESRALRPEERGVVERLLREQEPGYKTQLQTLSVVGRCGCGNCPTVFFQVHAQGDRERDLVSLVGRDSTGGLVGAVLLEKQGLLSQLEFYSVDGHNPWSIPAEDSLASC